MSVQMEERWFIQNSVSEKVNARTEQEVIWRYYKQNDNTRQGLRPLSELNFLIVMLSKYRVNSRDK